MPSESVSWHLARPREEAERQEDRGGRGRGMAVTADHSTAREDQPVVSCPEQTGVGHLDIYNITLITHLKSACSVCSNIHQLPPNALAEPDHRTPRASYGLEAGHSPPLV